MSLIQRANLFPIQTVDIPTETIKLADSQSGVEPGSVATHISSSSPRYSFYHYPGSSVVVFVYTCPTGSSIKERMLHASSRRSAIAVAEGEGLKIEKKVCSLVVREDAVADARMTDRGFWSG
jgi:twinfilin-like protein